MEAVKAFTSRCMEDGNAIAMYDAAVKKFEEHFDYVFEDLDGWMFGGPNGTVLPLDRMCNALKQVDAVLMATVKAVSSLSLPGLQTQSDVVIDTLVNAITVSKVGTWVYLHMFRIEVVDPLSCVNWQALNRFRHLWSRPHQGARLQPQACSRILGVYHRA